MQNWGQGDGISFIHSNCMSHNFQTLKWDKDLNFLHYNTVCNLHVIVLFKHASIIIMDVACWPHNKIIVWMKCLEVTFFVSNLVYLVIDSHRVSSCCLLFWLPRSAFLCISLNTNYCLFLLHNYTITTVYK